MEGHRRRLRGKGGFPEVTTEDDEETMEGEAWLDSAEPPKEDGKGEVGGEDFKIPKGWIWRSQHFEIARRMPAKDFKWMLKRSLTLHLRSMQCVVFFDLISASNDELI